MDSAIRIEPRFENPDGGDHPTAVGNVPVMTPVQQPLVAAPTISTWLYQNGYVVGGCILIVFIIVFAAMWFRKPVQLPAQQASQAPPAQQASQAPPAQQASQAPPAQPTAPVSPANQSSQPVAPAATPLTRQDIDEKLKALHAARRAVVDVTDNDLEALMENPEKKPESQDLAIESHI